MATKAKTVEDEVEAASEALSAASRRVHELEAQKTAIETALKIKAGYISYEDKEDEAEIVRKRRAAGLEVVRSGRRDHRLRADLEDIEDELVAARTAQSESRATLNDAKERVRTQLARDLQPRHRECVGEMAALLDELGRLSVEELEIRQQVAGLGGDHYLIPRAAIDGLGLPTEWNSHLSQWFRRMREKGLLGDTNVRNAA